MNKILYNISIIFFTSLLACQSSDSKKIDEKVTIDNEKRTILSANLKQGQIFTLSYSTSFFEQKRLMFSNPGMSDTTVINEMMLDAPFIASYSILKMSNKKSTSFYVLINPGDSINFKLNEEFHLQIDSINKQNLLSPPNSSFYSQFDNDKYKFGRGNNFKSKFQDFYSRLSATATAEKNRLENLFNSKQISEKYLSINKNYAEQLFYSNLFTYINKENNLPEDILKLYSKQADSAIKLFTNPGTIISDNLLPIFFGILKVKLRNQKKDYNDYRLLFAQAKKEDFGKFKAGLLFRFLKYPNTDDSFTDSVLNDISSLYPDSKYSLEVQKIRDINTKRNELVPGDTLLSLTKTHLPLDSIMNRQNKYILVDFWASWCTPCRALFPLMDSVKKQFSNKNIEFVTVSIDQEINDWEIASKVESKYLKTNNYYLLHNPKASLIKKYTINSIPRIMIFKNGKVVSNNFSSPSVPGFVDELKKVISQ